MPRKKKLPAINHWTFSIIDRITYFCLVIDFIISDDWYTTTPLFCKILHYFINILCVNLVFI